MGSNPTSGVGLAWLVVDTSNTILRWLVTVKRMTSAQGRFCLGLEPCGSV